MSLQYDVLIPTRNRLKALHLSLPLILSQTRLPNKLIIVDASDDHGTVCREVKQIVGLSSELQILNSEAGTAHQRNVGLANVQAPIVMMPDDDSLWYPDFAERVLRIYEKDTKGYIGGVAGSGDNPPPWAETNVLLAPEYKISANDRLKKSLDMLLNLFEKRFFPDPFTQLGISRRNVKPTEGWIEEEGAHFLPKMDGYRMSYRTNIIKQIRFDELLGRYALFEDYDAAFGVLGHSLIVETPKARMNHYKSPERRTSGLEWGVIQVLNRVYIVCKHAPSGSPPRQRLKNFLYYRFVISLPRIHSRWTRERLVGMLRGLPFVQQFLDASPLELPELYLRIRNVCLHRK